eukprot:1700799-Amphidinium_carterae.1
MFGGTSMDCLPPVSANLEQYHLPNKTAASGAPRCLYSLAKEIARFSKKSPFPPRRTGSMAVYAPTTSLQGEMPPCNRQALLSRDTLCSPQKRFECFSSIRIFPFIEKDPRSSRRDTPSRKGHLLKCSAISLSKYLLPHLDLTPTARHLFLKHANYPFVLRISTYSTLYFKNREAPKPPTTVELPRK